MTSGEIVGKMDTQNLLNVPLYDEVVARKPDVVEASKASQVAHFAVKTAYKLKKFIRL
jgi:hypothetical protein